MKETKLPLEFLFAKEFKLKSEQKNKVSNKKPFYEPISKTIKLSLCI